MRPALTQPRLGTVGLAITTACLAGLALAGCAVGASVTAPAEDGKVTVVASTNVYGSIAESIGGDLIEVTSLIDSAAQDPHSYEASARDQLSLSRADLVVVNGGGYDPFVETLISASDNSGVDVLDASRVSGLSTQDNFNEHVWYSFPAVTRVAEKIAGRLSEIDPGSAATFASNLADFTAAVSALEDRANGLRFVTAGRDAAITEPVPLYLIEAVGLGNATPSEFSDAIEEGTDVPPLVLRDTLALFSGNTVALLAYNGQTAGAQTEQVLKAAQAEGVPVVEFTETMPDDADYVSWMTANLDHVAAAVRE